MSDLETREAITKAMASTLPRCGDCGKWMKRPDCPRERGTMKGGPSCGALACEEFQGKDHP